MTTEQTQIFVASTAFGLASLAAAIEDGLYPRLGRRILITSNNAAVPEAGPNLIDVNGTEVLLASFDEVFSYNELIRPQHPVAWRPRAVDLPIWQRHLQRCWHLGEAPLHLIIESIQTPPALVLALIFSEARIDVYADGLMSYGPTRTALPAAVAARIERVVHLDLLPRVTPLLLSEHHVPTITVTDGAFTKIIDVMGAAATAANHDIPADTAILLGQYLSAGGLLSVHEEEAVYAEMVRGAALAGFTSLIFKPHPSAPVTLYRSLAAEAAAYGARLHIHQEPTLVETLFRFEHVGLVVGCFSTGLLTAASLYGLPVARVGTPTMLRRLTPYENSNRVPAALVDALVPDLDGCRPGEPRPAVHPDSTNKLLRAVAYGMQPQRYPWLRVDAEQLWINDRAGAEHYLGRGRAARLGLPGARPLRHPVKHGIRRLLGASAYNRIGRGARKLIKLFR